MPALAKTTARTNCAMSGIARSGFVPRFTARHVPGTSVYITHIPARYYVYGRVEQPAAQNEIQVVRP